MVAEYGIKLAVDIMTTDFGNVVAKVCECLLRRGTLTRGGISKFTELAAANVTKSLLVLIQHNCVQAFILGEEGDFGESNSSSTQYTALFDNIIHRLRFPKFLSIVSKELNENCASLLEGLLQHGRLTLTQILDRAKGCTDEGDRAEIAIRENFNELVRGLLVEHCPAPEPLVSLPTEEELAARRKAARSAKMFEKEVTLEERAIIAAKPMEAERFMTDKAAEAGEGNRSKGTLKKKVGKKRKLEVEDEHSIMDGDREPLWRVNFDEFKRRFRNKACVETVRGKLDDVAGMVLNAMVETTRMMESTVSLSLDAIYQEVIKNERGIQLNLEHVRASLEELGCESSDDDVYDVDLKIIIREAQKEELESIVLKRYGKEAYRLFRLLAEKDRPVETSKISADILVEQKDTKNILFKLWKDNFVHMEVAGRNPQVETLFWSVSKTVHTQVLDELYHAALNLRIRAALEMDRGREVTTVEKEKRGSEASKRYKKLTQVKLLLDSSLSKLDDAIMLFHDFI